MVACAEQPGNLNSSDNQLDSSAIPTIFPSPQPNQTNNNPENVPQGDNSEQNSLKNKLEGFNFDSNQFKVIGSDQVEWQDTCLGVEQPGADCTPQVTPGYLIVLEADGLEFEYHANQNGSQVQPATPALMWTRDGGEQEYCDKLIIYLPDMVHICWCEEGELETTSALLQEVLSSEDYEQLINALKHLSTTTLNQTASNGTNPAHISLTFYGQGKNLPDAQEQQTLLAIADTIYNRISQ
jgi:hypothetical protein